MINKIRELICKLTKKQKYEIAIIFCVIVILFTLFFEYIITILFVLAICIYYIYNFIDTQNKQIEQAKLNRLAEVENFCYTSLFDIVRENFALFSVMQPNFISDIVPNIYKNEKSGVVTYSMVLIKDKNTMQRNKITIKSKFNALIENYIKSSLFNFAFYNNEVALKVVRILEDNTYLIIEFIFIDNDYVYNLYMKSLNKNRPKINSQKVKVITTNSPKEGVALCYHEELYNDGNISESEIMWDYFKYPHLLVVGATGSGKTTFNLKLLEQLLDIKDVTIYVADFKGEDFNFLDTYKNYFTYKDCAIAINRLHQIMCERQQGIDKSRTPYFLLFDEVGAFLLLCDTKEAKDLKEHLASILMLGRSLKIFIILSLQRADASFFTNGARDNFGCVLSLGNMSKEAVNMLFSDCKDEIKNNRETGTGYLVFGGNSQSLVPVISLNVTDKAKLESDILKGLTS